MVGPNIVEEFDGLGFVPFEFVGEGEKVGEVGVDLFAGRVFANAPAGAVELAGAGRGLGILTIVGYPY